MVVVVVVQVVVVEVAVVVVVVVVMVVVVVVWCGGASTHLRSKTTRSRKPQASFTGSFLHASIHSSKPHRKSSPPPTPHPQLRTCTTNLASLPQRRAGYSCHMPSDQNGQNGEFATTNTCAKRSTAVLCMGYFCVGVGVAARACMCACMWACVSACVSACVCGGGRRAQGEVRYIRRLSNSVRRSGRHCMAKHSK